MTGEWTEARRGLALIRADRRFGALWCARTVSFLGDSLGLVALMLHVAGQTGQAFAVAMLLLAGELAPALFGPLAGALSDRFDLRRIMVGCELAQAALTVLIALWLPTLVTLLAVVAVRGLAAQVFAPASRAAVPMLVADPRLSAANATLGLGTNGAEVAGPLLAAVLLPPFGVRGVLLVDAVSFGLSAVLLATLPALGRSALGRSEPAGPGPSLRRAARHGLSYLRRAPVARAVVLGTFAVVACNGVDDVALVFLVRDSLGGTDASVAVLLGAVGIGLLAGYWLLGRHRGAGVSMVALLVGGFAVSSAGNLLTGLAWAVAAAFAMQTVRGLGIAAMDVATTTLLQRSVPADLHGRVFGTLYAAIGVAAALSYLGGALLLDATSARTVFLLVGAGGLMATALTAAVLLRRRDDVGAPAPPPR